MFWFVVVEETLQVLSSFPVEDADFGVNREYSQVVRDRKPPDSFSSAAHLFLL